MIYLILTSFIIFLVYNIISICKLKNIPSCLSETYYLWPKLVFPIVMFLVSGLILPVWLELLEGSNFQFCAFIICIALMFIGASPDYKNNDLDYKVHSTFTYVISIITIITIFIIFGYWEILLINLFIITLLFFITNFRKYWLFIIELCLFLSVYTTLIIKIF